MNDFIKHLIETYIGITIEFLFFSLAAFLIFWVLFNKKFQNRRIQKKKRANWVQYKSELFNAAIFIAINALLDAFLLIELRLSGQGEDIFKIYTDSQLFGGVPYILFTAFIFFVIEDTYFYWMHRSIHHPKLYKLIHKTHHASVDTTPFTSYSFHPIEGVLEAISVFLPLLYVTIFPVHIGALLLWQVGAITFNVIGHMGYEIYPLYWTDYWFLSWKTTSSHHNMHHEKFNGNYALYFTWWDRMMGTEFKNYKERHKKIFQSQNQKEEGFVSGVVDSIAWETDNTYSIYIKDYPSSVYNFKTGQHITIKVNKDDNIYFRTFSISSIPHIDHLLRITIKKVEKGRITPYLHKNLKADDNIEFSIPAGDFFIDPDPSRKRNILMIAAGSGITPIFAMLKDIVYNEPESSIKLIYINKKSSTRIFGKELDLLVKLFPKRLHKIDHLTSVHGKFSKKHIATTLQNFHSSEAYICGQDSFREMIRETLISLKFDKNKIKEESFVHNSTKGIKGRVAITYDGNINNITVNTDETILEASIREGMDIPFSCMSGSCGTCEAKCVSGKITMGYQTYLSEEKLKEGHVLLCQSKITSEYVNVVTV